MDAEVYIKDVSMRSAKCIRKVSATALGMQRHSEGRRVWAAAAEEVQKRSGIMTAVRESRGGGFSIVL